MRESLKPIEPGCLVLVRPLDRPVFVARVAEKAGWRTPEHPQHDVWWLEHDGPGETAGCECALIRIDPDEDQRRRWGAADRLQRIADKRGGRLSKAYRELEHKIREMDR